jgi:AcrR family transcriptional regulator
LENSGNRVKILDNALNLFATRGYDAVGVQEIVEASGVTKPTLYHYFGNKQGLLQALLAENFDKLYARLVEAANYQGDLPQTINRLIGAYFEFARTYPLFYRMQLGLWFAPPDSEAYQMVAHLNHKQYELIKEVFSHAATDHGNMKGRHEAYAFTFIGMVNTYISIAFTNFTSLDEQTIYQASHQFMYGIFS